MQKITIFFILAFISRITTLPAQWLPTHGLQGVPYSQFATKGDTILCATGTDLYYSTNSGLFWMPFTTSLPSNTIYDIEVFGEKIVARGREKIYVTTENGNSWQEIPTPVNSYSNEYFISDNSIFVLDYSRLLRTDNQGTTWDTVSSYDIRKPHFDGTALTGIHYYSLVRSYNLGITYDTLLTMGNSNVFVSQQGQQLYVLSGKPNPQFWYSPDNGTTWENKPGPENDIIRTFWAHNGVLFVLFDDALWHSTDNGTSWTGAPLPEGVSAFSAMSTGSTVLVSTFENGFLRSTDYGATWTSSNDGITGGNLGTMSIVDDHLMAPGMQGVFELNDDGINWTNLDLPIAPENGGFSYYLKTGDHIFAVNGYLPWVSTDEGVSWIKSSAEAWTWQYPLVWVLQTPNRLIAREDHDFRFNTISDDHGISFQPVPIDQTVMHFQWSMQYGQGILYALQGGILYSSNDEGHNWTAMTSPQPAYYNGGLLVAGNTLIIQDRQPSDSFSVQISTDLGQTWVTQAGTVQDRGFQFFVEIIGSGDYLIAATTNGVYLSQDAGLTWTVWSEGLRNTNIRQLMIYNDWLFAGTDAGIWKRPLSDLGLQPIQGEVFYDENNNGVRDAEEHVAGSIAIQSLQTGAFTTSTAEGAFSLYSNHPQETLQVHPPRSYWSVTPAQVTTAVPATGISFALQTNSDIHDLSIDLTNVSALRPGFETDYVLQWHNNTLNISSETSLSLIFPAELLELVNVTPAPSFQNDNMLTWDLGQIGPIISGTMQLRFYVPETVVLGTNVCVNAVISGSAADSFPNDNSEAVCALVVGSFDPNDKQAIPANLLTPDDITAGKPISYTVRFQNTGTYSASTVRILDTIQSGLDPATFQFIAASHRCRWAMNGQGIVEFIFENIQLPDSGTDEPGSHGFVRYSVQAKEVPLGTRLRNTAHIFFDFNKPIVTNTTQTTVNTDLNSGNPIKAVLLILRPNPANDWVWVEHEGAEGMLRVYDLTGRLLQSQSTDPASKTLLLTGDLLPGIYEVVLEAGGGRKTGRLVVAR